MCFQVDVQFIGVLSDDAARRRVMISGLRRRFLLQIIFLLCDYIYTYRCFSHCTRAEIMTVTFMVYCLCMHIRAHVRQHLYRKGPRM